MMKSNDTKQYPWSPDLPAHDGDFYFNGTTPTGQRYLGIVQVFTSQKTGRGAAIFIPPTGKLNGTVIMDKLKNWKGEWSGPEFGLSTAVGR